jgi:hypothetical protein
MPIKSKMFLLSGAVTTTWNGNEVFVLTRWLSASDDAATLDDGG